MGPPKEHPGKSHNNKPEFSKRYVLAMTFCLICGFELTKMRPISKIINDFDASFRMRSFTSVIEHTKCPHCNTIFKAPNPGLDGTSFGPTPLSVFTNYFEHAITDLRIAKIIKATYGFYVSESGIINARNAISKYMLKNDMILQIMQEIMYNPGVQMDETSFNRGDGHKGYTCIARTPTAAFVWFAYNRKAHVLFNIFSWLQNKPIVCDGLSSYKTELSKTIQRCFVHLLRKAEALAVTKGYAEDEERYDKLLELYKDAKDTNILAPFTIIDPSRRAYEIVKLYKDESTRTHILNAIPDMFTFLAFPGMPPHNNGTEILIRDHIIGQRNVRRKTMTREGRKTLSMLLTFTATCKIQDISSGRALLEYLLNPDWNIFEDGKNTPYSLTNPDGTRYSLFDNIDTP